MCHCLELTKIIQQVNNLVNGLAVGVTLGCGRSHVVKKKGCRKRICFNNV